MSESLETTGSSFCPAARRGLAATTSSRPGSERSDGDEANQPAAIPRWIGPWGGSRIREIDAVVIATPDHWHAPASIAACLAGKDVYVEMPHCYDIHESRAMLDVAGRTQRVLQVGTQNRSAPYNLAALDYVRSGKLGDVRLVKVYNLKPDGPFNLGDPGAPPPAFDWDAWVVAKAEIRNHVRRLRFENGEMTQQELAEQARCTRQTIIALEQGKYVPSLALAFRIARAFGQTVEEVFEPLEEGDGPSPSSGG